MKLISINSHEYHYGIMLIIYDCIVPSCYHSKHFWKSIHSAWNQLNMVSYSFFSASKNSINLIKEHFEDAPGGFVCSCLI